MGRGRVPQRCRELFPAPAGGVDYPRGLSFALAPEGGGVSPNNSFNATIASPRLPKATLTISPSPFTIKNSDESIFPFSTFRTSKI